MTVYEDESSVLDLDVLDALEVLIRNHTLEEQGAGIRTARLSGPAQRVYDQVRRICEWRLGRQPLHPADPPGDRWATGELSLAELLLCLSVSGSRCASGTSRVGRQGYLDYVPQFLEDARRRAGV